MKQKLPIILIVITLVVAGAIILYRKPSAPAPAQIKAIDTIPHTPEIVWAEPDGRFQFTLPADWDITVTKENVFVIAPLDKSAVITMRTIKTKELETPNSNWGGEQAAVTTKPEGDREVTNITTTHNGITYMVTVSIDTTKPNTAINKAAYEKIRSSFVFLK